MMDTIMCLLKNKISKTPLFIFLRRTGRKLVNRNIESFLVDLLGNNTLFTLETKLLVQENNS